MIDFVRHDEQSSAFMRTVYSIEEEKPGMCFRFVMCDVKLKADLKPVQRGQLETFFTLVVKNTTHLNGC